MCAAGFVQQQQQQPQRPQTGWGDPASQAANAKMNQQEEPKANSAGEQTFLDLPRMHSVFPAAMTLRALYCSTSYAL